MEVLFFTEFSKRKNSTKVPDDSTGITKEVYLKGTTDKINPTFFLKGTDDYVYCKAWGWYYFVHRIGYDIDGAQMVYCNLDVLATFKEYILNTEAFVLFSTSDYSSLLRDDRTPTLADMSSETVIEDSMYFEPSDNSVILLTCIGEDLGLQTWVFPENDFRELLMSCLIPDGVASWWENLELQFGDAFGSIVSARRAPVDRGELPYYFPDEYGKYLKLGSFQPIFGDPETGETYFYPCLTRSRISELKEIRIPWHYTDYRRLEPYQKLLISLPFVGEVNLAVSDFICGNKLYIRMDADLITGSVAYTVSNSENRIVGVYNGIMGGDIPVGSHQVQNEAKVVAGLATAGVIALGMETAMMPITEKGIGGALLLAGKSFVNGQQHTSSILGAYSGSWGEFALANYRVTVQWCSTRIEPSNLTELYGRPCNKVRTINGLTGFVQTIGFSIDMSVLDVIKDSINGFMDSGVYLE